MIMPGTRTNSNASPIRIPAQPRQVCESKVCSDEVKNTRNTLQLLNQGKCCPRPINTPGVSDNKGKCTQLVEYLSKESQDVRPYYDNFFSQQKDFVTPRTVMHHIDNNQEP